MACDKASFARGTRSVMGLQIERKNTCLLCGPRSITLTYIPGLGACCEYCRKAQCAQLTSFPWDQRRRTEALTEERRSRKSVRNTSSSGSIQEGDKRKGKTNGQMIDYVWYDKSSEASLSKVMKLLRPSKKMTTGKCEWRREDVNLPGILKFSSSQLECYKHAPRLEVPGLPAESTREKTTLDIEEQFMMVKEDPDTCRTVWNCSKCNYTSMRRYAMKIHIERHMSGPSHQCPSCSHTCATKNALRVHMCRMHRNESLKKKNTKKYKISKKVVLKFVDDKKTATMKNLASRRVIVVQVDGGRV